MRKIPKQQKNTNTNTIPKPEISFKHGISFSFEILEKTEYFNLDSTCTNWANELFEMMKNVSQVNQAQLTGNTYKTYRVHPHGNAHSPSPFPENIAQKDCYQIRLSKSKGAIHGVFYENVFYVIWLDPLHNMYPDSRYGGLKKIKPPKNCCMDRKEELEKLNDENERLREELEICRKELKTCTELLDNI